MREAFLKLLVSYIMAKPPRRIKTEAGIAVWYRYAQELNFTFTRNFTSLVLLCDGIELYQAFKEKLEEYPESEEIQDFLIENENTLDMLASVFGESFDTLGLK